MPGLQYPYTGTPPAYAFGHQMSQIPTPYQTHPHMTVPMPYMNIPPPFPVPGNIYYPTPQTYNPNLFVPSVDARHVVHPLQGQCIIAGAQPPQPRHSHTGGMSDDNNFRPVSRVNRHSKGRATCCPETEDKTVTTQRMVQQEREQPGSSSATPAPGAPNLSDEEGSSVLLNVSTQDSVMEVCSPGETCKDSLFKPDNLLSHKDRHTALNRPQHSSSTENMQEVDDHEESDVGGKVVHGNPDSAEGNYGDSHDQPDSFLCTGRASHLTWRGRRSSC